VESNQQRIEPRQSEDLVRNSGLLTVLFVRRELEQRLRELKRRKKEKKMTKLKEFEEEREKDKKRWTDFNSKVVTSK
jgi:hypothetical protein